MMSSREYMLTLLLASVTLVGCGRRSDLEKVVVEGAVTFGGTPIANGEIRFHPIDGTPGPVSGGPIKDGHYEAVTKGGVPVGRHRITVIGYDVQGASADDDMVSAAAARSERVNFVPAKYNDESELTVDVPADESTFTYDLDLLP